MFNLAFDMVLLPARLAWQGLRWGYRRWRRGNGQWRSMAQARSGGLSSAPFGPPLPDPSARSTVPAAPGLPLPATAGDAGPDATAASTAVAAAGTTTDNALDRGVIPGDEPHELARFHTREGDGFRLIFHFQLRKQRVRRTVWLDFTRLAKRMGREQAWAMRARLGHSQMRYAVDQPARPWGRLELPQAWLAVESTRGLKARTFMLETLDAVNALIDAGGIELVSGQHQSLPPGDPRPPATVLAAGGRGGGRATPVRGSSPARHPAPAQAELGLEGAAGAAPGTPASGAQDAPLRAPPMPPIVPDASQDSAGLPRGVTPEHVCTGILAAAGVTERSDATGRNYRIFYADVDVGGRLSRQTGVDLERALYDAHAAVGMRVRLQHLGYVPVNGGRHRRKVWQATVLPG